ncbi:LD-carboxypeptidase [Myxococcota bacterium]|nr:LD-carboxypeptidase [Myxococcota bacterium]
MTLLPGIVFPSSPVPSEALADGLRFLPGHKLFSPEPDQWPFLAGSDADRTRLLCEALRDPEVDLLIAARGGHGALRLDRDRILGTLKEHPKPIIGFSDVTALHFLWQVAGVPSVAGPNVTQLPLLPADQTDRVLHLLSTGELGPLGVPLTAHRDAQGQTVAGPLAGGNLAVIASSAGTPWAPSFSGRIVFLEEVHEAPYRIDRMLWQILHATDLTRAAAIVFGEFTECPGFRMDLLLATCGQFAPGVPLFSGFPSGHGATNVAFVSGAVARIDGRTATLTQPGVRFSATS